MSTAVISKLQKFIKLLLLFTELFSK